MTKDAFLIFHTIPLCTLVYSGRLEINEAGMKRCLCCIHGHKLYFGSKNLNPVELKSTYLFPTDP